MFDYSVMETSNLLTGEYIEFESPMDMLFWVDAYFCEPIDPAEDTIRLIKDDNFIVDIATDLSYCCVEIFKIQVIR